MSVFVIGNFVVDIIGKPIDRLPEQGTLLLLDTLETHPGGNGRPKACAVPGERRAIAPQQPELAWRMKLAIERAALLKSLGHVQSVVERRTTIPILSNVRLEASDGTVRNSLYGVLDETVTPMGARLLRQWLLQPLLDREAIAARQDAVAALVEAPDVRDALRRLLKPVEE